MANVADKPCLVVFEPLDWHNVKSSAHGTVSWQKRWGMCYATYLQHCSIKLVVCHACVNCGSHLLLIATISWGVLHIKFFSSIPLWHFSICIRLCWHWLYILLVSVLCLLISLLATRHITFKNDNFGIPLSTIKKCCPWIKLGDVFWLGTNQNHKSIFNV